MLRREQIIGLVAVAVAMIVIRVLAGGIAENARAKEFVAAGNTAEAIAAYDRSLHWYLPGSPTVTTAVNGLRDIASTAEEAGDLETALIAWRTIRSGMYASRWLVTPGKDLIETANGHIARLVAVRAENDAPGSGRQAHDEEMTILTREVGPKTGWSVLAVIAFFGWIAAVVLFILRAFGPADEFYRRPALLYGLAFVACFALWMLGLSRA